MTLPPMLFHMLIQFLKSEQDETTICLPNDDEIPSIPHSHNAHDDTNISNIDDDATFIT